MLWAVVDDLLQISGCHVSTTLDARLAHDANERRSPQCQIEIVANVDEERRQFDVLTAASDAVLVIAPETNGSLARRVRRVVSLGAKSLNCSPDAIELCGDKLHLARHFEGHALPTLPTQLLDWSSLLATQTVFIKNLSKNNTNRKRERGRESSGIRPHSRFRLVSIKKRCNSWTSSMDSKRNIVPHPTPTADGRAQAPTTGSDLDPVSEWVIKPRDGAGSWLTFRVRTDSPDEWQRAATAYAAAGVAHKALIQPFVAGRPLSVGCHCPTNGEVEIFPIGQQRLSRDFQYMGGSIPASLPTRTEVAVHDLVRRACATIPGLCGHIGFDLLLPDADPTRPLIVEINPRLTTSYVGYRRLSASNLAARWIHNANPLNDANISPRSLTPLEWSPRRIEFDASGNTLFDDAP